MALLNAMFLAPPPAKAEWRRSFVVITLAFGIPLSGLCWLRRAGVFRELAEVDCDCSEEKLIGGVTQPTQSETGDAECAFQLCEAHLDFLSVVAGLLVGWRSLERSRHIAGVFVDGSADGALIGSRAAL